MSDNHEWARKLTHKIVEHTKHLSVSNAAFCVLANESDLLNTMAEAIQCADEQLCELAKSIKTSRANLKKVEEKITEAQQYYEARQRHLVDEQTEAAQGQTR